MKTFNYKGHLVTALHLLFWILSFNLFNAFFSRGIESEYVLEGFSLSIGEVLLISNIIVVILLSPFIWLVKGIG
ncbi:MAG TPA: hypothetical protein VGK38_03800, partial [Prolixibacteraceae bacterium]